MRLDDILDFNSKWLNHLDVRQNTYPSTSIILKNENELLRFLKLVFDSRNINATQAEWLFWRMLLPSRRKLIRDSWIFNDVKVKLGRRFLEEITPQIYAWLTSDAWIVKDTYKIGLCTTQLDTAFAYLSQIARNDFIKLRLHNLYVTKKSEKHFSVEFYTINLRVKERVDIVNYFEALKPEEKFMFLGAFVDGDGRVYKCGKRTGRLFIYNKNIELLKTITGFLAELEINSKLWRKRAKNVYVLELWGNSAKKILKHIRPYIKHPRKSSQADRILRGLKRYKFAK